MGRSVSAVRTRLWHGWGEREAILTPTDDPMLTRAKRRGDITLTYNGETQTVSEWARRFGLKRTTLRHRIAKGWSVEKALTTPVGAQ